MTPKANSRSDRSKKSKPASASSRGSGASTKQAPKRPGEVVIPIMASDERNVQPYRDAVEPTGPMNKSTVHQTESKVNHPMGKTRSGVAQRRGR